MSDEATMWMPDDVRLRALMVSYQSGELGAFDELYVLLSPQLRRWLHARVHNVSEADDLTQEAFLQIHRARHTYDSAYPVTPWAIAIARHVWLMHRRTASRRPQAADRVDAPETAVRAEAETYAMRADVRAALSSLREGRRHAVIWHHVFGFSFREIAERFGVRETAAKLRSSRGMAELRARLRAKNDHE